MTVALVFAMFVAFFVVEKFTHEPAFEYAHQTAPHTEGVAGTVHVASYEVPDPPHLYRVRTGTDRRQTNRSARRSLPAA
jgi:hypothetical protein